MFRVLNKLKILNKNERILPFFPLGVFLLPGEDLPLRIFEPRYLQLIEEAKQEGFTFVIPFSKDDKIKEYGCEVKLQQVVAESDIGNKVITVESIALVQINTFINQGFGKLYSSGYVQTLPPSDIISDQKLIDLVINFTEHYDNDFLKSFSGDELRYFDIIKPLNLSSEDKYNFIHMHSNEDRVQFLTKQIEYLMLLWNQEKMLDDNFNLN